jgi:hypothetical protein
MQSRVSRVSTPRLAGLAVMVFLFAGCTVAQGPTSSQSDGLHIHSDGLRTDMTTHMCIAYLAADAGIAGFGPSHWNSPDGTKPSALDDKTIVRNGYAIYRPLQFSSMHILRDQRPEPTSEFDTVGGQVGPDTYSSDDPQVTPGGRYVLLFVPGIDPIAQAWNEKVMIVVAAWPIDEKGIVTLKPAHTEEGQDNQTENFPAVTKPLAQIVQQLADCKAG